MKWIYFLFGEDKNINAWQMADRAIVIFIITLALIRLAGLRAYGRRSAVDNVISIILGAIMSRAATGASPFVPIVLASFALVMMHRLFAWLAVYNDSVGKWVKGECLCLYKDGEPIIKNMKKAMISHKDMVESIRLMINEDNYDHVKEIYIERNGDLSVVRK